MKPIYYTDIDYLYTNLAGSSRWDFSTKEGVEPNMDQRFPVKY